MDYLKDLNFIILTDNILYYYRVSSIRVYIVIFNGIKNVDYNK